MVDQAKNSTNPVRTCSLLRACCRIIQYFLRRWLQDWARTTSLSWWHDRDEWEHGLRFLPTSHQRSLFFKNTLGSWRRILATNIAQLLAGDPDLEGEVDDVTPDMVELDEPPLVVVEAADAPAAADHGSDHEVLAPPPDGEDVPQVPQSTLSSTASRDLSPSLTTPTGPPPLRQLQHLQSPWR